MPTENIRPNSTTSQAGWSVSNIHTVIGDNDLGTKATQNSTTCNFTGTLEDLSIDASSTINSLTAVFIGVAGRTGNNTLTLSFVHPTDGTFGGSTKTVTSDGIYSHTAVTTQQDGSSALTVAYVNDLSILVAPGTSGIDAKEVLVTVDYTLPVATTPTTYDATTNNIHITSGNINVTSGNIFI
jgi:hypothetical protein